MAHDRFYRLGAIVASDWLIGEDLNMTWVAKTAKDIQTKLVK